MGVKGTCRSGNRGGCPSFMLNPPHIWANIQHPPAYPLPIIGAKVAKVNNFLVCFGVSSGKSETTNGKI